MNVKYLKVYENVYFGKKLYSHFPNLKVSEPVFDVVPGVGVKITDTTDSIFVPYTNVAFVQLHLEEKKAASGSKKAAKK